MDHRSIGPLNHNTNFSIIGATSMYEGGLILAMTLMGFAIWLQRTEKIGWPQENAKIPRQFQEEQRDESYISRRRRSRTRVNGLFFLCGFLILVATLGTPQNRSLWIACWMSVVLVMMVIVILAGLDVTRTLRHFREKAQRKRRMP